MPSYETIDFFADLYIPLLVVIWIIKLLLLIYAKQKRQCMDMWIGVLVNIIVAYGIMGLDNAFMLFKRVGLDYSTHTAVAFAIIFSIIKYPMTTTKKAPEQVAFSWALMLSLLIYLAVMKYQQYHTIADMGATLALLTPLYFTITILILKRQATFSRESL